VVFCFFFFFFFFLGVGGGAFFGFGGGVGFFISFSLPPGQRGNGSSFDSLLLPPLVGDDSGPFSSLFFSRSDLEELHSLSLNTAVLHRPQSSSPLPFSLGPASGESVPSLVHC